MNTLIVGMTQSGKSTAEAKRLADWKGALLLCDPHNSLAMKYLAWLACKEPKTVVAYDDIRRTDRVLRWSLLERSKASDQLIREKENEDRARAFADILCRRRGLDISKTPLIEKWALAALRLWIHQHDEKPLTDILDAFRPRTRGFNELLRDCSDDSIVHEFEDIKSFPSIRAETRHAERLIAGTLNETSLRIRTGGGFPYEDIFRQGGKIIIAGDRDNRNSTRVIMSCIIQLAIRYVRSGGGNLRIVADEANNYELVGRPELESLAEDAKLGLEWDIIVQSLNFGDRIITDSILTNTDRHEWFRCSADTAKDAAMDIGIRQLDPYKVHHIDKKKKQLHDGYDREIVKTKGWQTGKSVTEPNKPEETKGERSSQSFGELEQARARYNTIEEETVHYEKLNDQILLWQQRVMTQPVGHRFVVERGHVLEEQVVPMEPHPWEQVAINRAIKKMEESVGRHGMPPFLASSNSTQSRSRKPLKSASSGSTPKKKKGAATRLLGGGSTDSPNESGDGE